MESSTGSFAKIAKPRLQKVLARHRLFHMLDRSLAYPSTWVCGPAGSGKTTLVASYLEERHLPGLWYQIDESDSDAATFFYYLGVAGRNLDPLRNPLPLLTPEYASSIPVFARRFFEDLFDRFETPGVLVLDNYQEVSQGSEFHEVVRSALSVAPEGISVLIMSRTEPPPLLAHAIASSRMRQISWPALRLQQEETRELVHLLNRKRLPDKILDIFHKRIDGWVAGLILLLKCAETEAGAAEEYTRFTMHEAFDYFTTEIFEKADSKTRDFLLATSFLPVMTAQMAQRLTNASDAEKVFSRLLLNHWFTTRYPGAETRYQYHAMFREYLMDQAVQVYSEAGIAELQKAAAGLLEADGQQEPAMDLLFATGSIDDAIALILRNAQRLSIQGRTQTLEQWLRRLPDQVVRSHPYLLYWLGLCCHRSHPDEGRGYFREAFTIFEAQGDKVGICSALCGILDSITYEFSTFRALDQWIPKLSRLSSEYDQLPSPEIKGQLTASALLALTFRQPSHPEFKTWEKRGLEVLQGDFPEYIKLRVIAAWCGYRLFTGDLAGSAYFIDLCREMLRAPKVPPYARISLKNLESFYFSLSGDFEACERSVEEALELASETGIHVLSPLVLGHGASAALSRGDLARAGTRLRRMTRYINSSDWIFIYFHSLSIWKALLEKDPQKALLNEEFASAYVTRSGMVMSDGLWYQGMALALNAAGKTGQARKRLDQALSICRSMGVRMVEFGCYLTQAELAMDAGDDEGALEALRKALQIGKEQQYMHAWYWRPEAMARLLGRALEADIEADYARNLIFTRHLIPENSRLDLDYWPWPIRIYSLGRFALIRNGQALSFSGKAQEKPLDLLAAIIELGGRNVGENRIADLLWPEADGDAAHGALKTNVHRLRKLLGCREAIQRRSGTITLDSRYCWVDAWVFDRRISEAEAAWESAADEADLQFASELTRKALLLYKGPLLQARDDRVIHLRDHLHNRFLWAVQKLGRYLQGRRKWEAAISIYEAGLKIDRLVEPFYRDLMICNHRLGRRSKAIAAYERCEKVLSENLRLQPAAETRALKRSLLK